VGVATGRTSAAELAAAGADCVLESMADVGATLRAFGVA
jgi:phosphoglycolate phosphatase-like HAD superfamily hydrolase